MQAWFLSNDLFKGATLEVQNIEEFHWLNESYSPTVKQLHTPESRLFYFGPYQGVNVEPKFQNPRYLSLLNHLRFNIPEIYPQLEKFVFLDDDVVVQKKLTPLFSLDLHGNVNGAVETCLEVLHWYYKYLNLSISIMSSKFDPQACGWALGMNIFDMGKANVTASHGGSKSVIIGVNGLEEEGMVSDLESLMVVYLGLKNFQLLKDGVEAVLHGSNGKKSPHVIALALKVVVPKVVALASAHRNAHSFTVVRSASIAVDDGAEVGLVACGDATSSH
ncbi:galacturonosyltransferase 11 [Spatholobus suberectus]|nr:galacturonosyltransferase 11 [Spatholobus suberectus]